MSFISAKNLSRRDLTSLGNNLKSSKYRRNSVISATNRSLSVHGEAVRNLFKPVLTS